MIIIKENLFDAVVNQIEKDYWSGDKEALYELLKHVPVKTLLAYLPEEESQKFKDVKDARK